MTPEEKLKEIFILAQYIEGNRSLDEKDMSDLNNVIIPYVVKAMDALGYELKPTASLTLATGDKDEVT